jgi:hypothetical protein
MNNDIEAKFSKILTYYNELGEKKLLKNSLKELNVGKKVYLYYSKSKCIPVCTLPNLDLILASKEGFVSFCCNFFSYIESTKSTIEITSKNIASIAKFVISHEVGHILDPTVINSKIQYEQILAELVEKIVKYDIDIKDINLHKINLPIEVEDCIIKLKRNLIDRESKAWIIAKRITEITDDEEEFLFDKMREYALATYNFGNLKTIIKDHNIEIIYKCKRFLAAKKMDI